MQGWIIDGNYCHYFFYSKEHLKMSRALSENWLNLPKIIESKYLIMIRSNLEENWFCQRQKRNASLSAKGSTHTIIFWQQAGNASSWANKSFLICRLVSPARCNTYMWEKKQDTSKESMSAAYKAAFIIINSTRTYNASVAAANTSSYFIGQTRRHASNARFYWGAIAHTSQASQIISQYY